MKTLDEELEEIRATDLRCRQYHPPYTTDLYRSVTNVGRLLEIIDDLRKENTELKEQLGCCVEHILEEPR